MNKSEEIKDLALALSQFQGEVEDIPKNKEVRLSATSSFKHADLSGVLDIVRPLLCKYGLAVVQLPGCTEDKITVETVLMHKSGQWISSTIEMAMDSSARRMSGPQEVGKFITYARRYGLAAIVGVTQVDDEQSMININHKQTKSEPEIKKETISAFEANDLKRIINADVPTSNWIRQAYNITRLEELTKPQYIEIKDKLRIMDGRIEEDALSAAVA